ncbi:hypothetical protein CRX72_18005 [Pantoea sp. BRM17]|nr:hypothetical protein CRX72_18005 [Pantoea sp. BRM17]
MDLAIERARQPSQTLRLKAPSCIMRWLLPRLIAFEQRYPATHVALTTTQEHLSQLEEFDAAIVYGLPPPDARCLNLTHAARELYLTQSAVSRKVATLENWLGFALFQRHARGLRLTERGAALLPELQQSYQQLLAVTAW